MTKQVILKDTTGEYIAAYTTADSRFFVMNITAQLDDTDVNDERDETNTGWDQISDEEM